jgi:hypothetical protein
VGKHEPTSRILGRNEAVLQIISPFPKKVVESRPSQVNRLRPYNRPPRRKNMTEESNPTPENTAIAHCYGIWLRVYKAEMAKGEHWMPAARSAGQAYRKAMPTLTGQENIENFIACVAHGMLIGAIEGNDATKLLYAAQVALSTLQRQSSRPKAKTA